MSDIRLTPEQLEATLNTGGQLLVSAAAGSGKTKVLVERLLNHIDSGAHIDEFLIITYTNAAAAELRGKIMDALYLRLADDPGNKALRREINLCGKASISTIHGFCAGVIRENANILGITPDFRIADENESLLIKQETINSLLDELYDSGDEEFYSLADTMGAGRDDSALVSIILDTHTKLLSHTDPKAWVDLKIKELELDGITDAAKTKWGNVIIGHAVDTAKYCRERLIGILDDSAVNESFIKAYGGSINETVGEIDRFITAAGTSWDDAYRASEIDFPRAKSVSGFDDLKDIRSQCKKELDKLPLLFGGDSKKVLSEIAAAAPAVRALLKIVLRFDEAYSARKRRRGILDFSDQEHFALKLLTECDGSPTDIAREISTRYREIMVDEYQDVNEIQECIFNAVSRSGNNIFMVGDVKQSIYRFRLADPTIFLNKYLSFAKTSEASDGEGRKIILSKNFRSRSGVLDACNYIFRNTMSVKFGDIDYTENEYLYTGAAYPASGTAQIELDVIDARSDDDDAADDKTALEARFAAKRIKELVLTESVSDGAGGMRPAKFSDIAIIMRSHKSRLPKWSAALAREGIPVATEGNSDFFTEFEISLIMSILSIVDNPHQDIPLISVLRSPIYGFTSDDLAKIRLADKEGDFYSALKTYSESDDKCAGFLNELNKFRAAAPDKTSDEMLWYICNETDLFAIVSAMPEGKKRRDNLLKLFEYARSFESSGYKGLFGFITYIRYLSEQGKMPAEDYLSGSENAVKIMSIHKSKGLEFPIVILADTTHQFNTDDLKKPLLIHSELGAGPKYTDLKRKLAYPTIARNAVKIKISEESLSEELRVLYVAMTRAKEKLIILASYSNAEKELQRLSNVPLPVPVQMLRSAKCMADWILAPALRREESAPLHIGTAFIPCADDGTKWDMRLVKSEECGERSESEPAVTFADIMDNSDVSEIAEKLSFRYPHSSAESIPSKITATELKGTYASEEAAEEAAKLDAEFESAPAVRPAFMDGKRGLTAAQRGTAAHIVMQYADYQKCQTSEGAAAEIERLRVLRTISDEQAAAVRPSLISRFFSGAPGKLILSAEKVWRELKFSLLVDSGEIKDLSSGEQVLLQGVVDCCVMNDGKLTIIDFKTDYVTEATVDERAAYYQGQLDAYALAMKRILNKPVEKKILCFLTAGIYRELK